MSIESERLDRMEQHLKLLKKSAEDQNKTLDSIESALVGTIYNGNKGITHILHDVDFRLEKLENDYNITKDNMNQLKWFARGLGGVIFAIVLWSVTK